MPTEKITLSQDQGTNNWKKRSDIVTQASHKLLWDFITVFANQNPLQESDWSRNNSFSLIISSPYNIGNSTTQFSPEIESHRNNTVKVTKRIMEWLRDTLNSKQETKKPYRVVEILDWFSYPNNPHHHITLAQEGSHLETITKKERGDFLTNAELKELFWSQKFFDAVYSILDNQKLREDLISLQETDERLKKELTINI
jgi:hypothetical protein